MPFVSSYAWENIDQLEKLLLRWTIFLLLSVVVTAIGYYSWRKTSERAFHLRRLSLRQRGFAAVMSVAVPMLAACIQSAWVVRHGIWFYTAMLWGFPNSGLWIVVAIEGLITFGFFWLFMKVALWFRWPVLLLCLTFWTYIGFVTIAVVKGYV